MTSTVAAAVERFLDQIEHGRSRDAIDLSVAQLEHDGVAATVTGLLAPAQQEVGLRWHQGRYTIAQEHQTTAVVDDVLGLASSYTDRPDDASRTIALVCAEGEWHGTPARMAAMLFRDAGWRVQFLGASTPADHLRTTLREARPTAVAVSCTLPLALPGAANLVELAHDLGLPAIVGGRAFDDAGHRAAQLGADGSFHTATDAVPQLEDWLGRPPAPRTSVSAPDLASERASLVTRRDDVIQATYVDLEHRLPVMAGFDDRQRRHTLEDLDYLLRFADIALFVDDASVMTDVIIWLDGLLTARGLPPAVMQQTIEALHMAIGDDAPVVRRWLLELTQDDRPSAAVNHAPTTPMAPVGRPAASTPPPAAPPRATDDRTQDDLLTQLAEIAQQLADTDTLDELLQLIVELGTDHVDGCDGTSLMLVGPNRTISTPAYSSRVAYESDLAQYETDEGPCLDALRDDATYLIDDLETEERWPAYRARALELGVRSMLSFRLFVSHRTYGALDLYAARPHVYGPSSQVMGQVFASHASVALKAAITEAGLERVIESRDLIGQAKGILMERRRMTATEAFQTLDELSQERNIALRDLAGEIAATGQIPD